MDSWRREVRAHLRLAAPVVAIQIGLMMMGLVDTAFLGRVSETDLAAVAVGDWWTFLLLSFGIGTLSALDPIVSQAWGARDRVAITRGLQRGLLLALVLSVPLGIIALWTERTMLAMGQLPAVAATAGRYATVLVASMPAFLLFVAVRQTLQAMHVLRPLLFVIVACNLLNAGLDWVLIFGHFGCPALGAVGSAWATVVSRWAMLGLLVFLAWPALRPYLSAYDRKVPALAPIGRMLALGAPVGGQFLIEIGAFGTVMVMMGTIGDVELSGHTVALKLASFSFMVPLGISMAASVRVGNAIGRGDHPGTKRAAKVALLGGAGVMLVFAAAFLLVPYPLARVFTDLPGVLAIAVVLLPLAGFFQVFDGIQVVALGILRGSADTRLPMLIHLAGFWLVGVPAAYLFGFALGHGPAGLWWGLVLALAAVASTLLLRVRARFARAVARLRVEDEETSVSHPTAP
ncbi:MAG: MATE family efflux transporter [Planctomycetota bacterium]